MPWVHSVINFKRFSDFVIFITVDDVFSASMISSFRRSVLVRGYATELSVRNGLVLVSLGVSILYHKPISSGSLYRCYFWKYRALMIKNAAMMLCYQIVPLNLECS